MHETKSQTTVLLKGAAFMAAARRTARAIKYTDAGELWF